MNEYGEQALTYWKTYRPTALDELLDPEEFFTDLGQRAQERETSLWLELQEQAWAEDPTADYNTRLGLSNMARMQAQEIVRDEMIWLPKEPGTEELELHLD